MLNYDQFELIIESLEGQTDNPLLDLESWLDQMLMGFELVINKMINKI